MEDNRIMLEVKKGNLSALSLLFERHQRALFNYFLKMSRNRALSDDLVQEVFLRLMRYRHTFRGAGNFRTWLFSIARNVYTDHFRKKREEPLPDDWPRRVEPMATAQPHQRAEENEQSRLLFEALDSLSTGKKEALILSRFHDLRYREIADIQGCSEGVVKTRVFRAMQDLRKIFSELTGERAS